MFKQWDSHRWYENDYRQSTIIGTRFLSCHNLKPVGYFFVVFEMNSLKEIRLGHNENQNQVPCHKLN